MPYQDVDDYIDQAPTETQSMLKVLREIIKTNAPLADERISYQMPFYDYLGRLIYFAGYKSHVGLYIMSDARLALADEIKPYQTSKATLQFPAGQPLPTALIEKIVMIQVAANEQNKPDHS